MTWFGWVMVTWWVLSTLITIGSIDKARPRITSQTASIMVIGYALMIWATIVVGTHHG
jgi:hypothetical protein